MNKEFTVDDWQNVAIMFILMIDKHEKGMHSIQVFKKDIEGGGYLPIDVSIKDNGDQVVLSINKDPFAGYIVIR